MSPRPFATALLSVLALGACTTYPTRPVEVTRFHQPSAMLGVGAITVAPARSLGTGVSFEQGVYQTAVARELGRVGYTLAGPRDQGRFIAEVRVDRQAWRPERARGPVSVGVGGSTGSYGSGVGVGVGIDLSGPPPEQVETELGVMIRERSTGATVWEGRASSVARANTRLGSADTDAARLAAALFRGFPGRSGETIAVP
jgi:hypothetical protein